MGEEIFKLILVDLGVCIAVGIVFDVLKAVFVRTKTCCCKVRYVLLLVMQWYVYKNVADIGRACSICCFPIPSSPDSKAKKLKKDKFAAIVLVRDKQRSSYNEYHPGLLSYRWTTVSSW